MISPGVGKDSISDFTNNLIHGFLLNYTEVFAKKHIKNTYLRHFSVGRVRFNYETETWERGDFALPFHAGSYVLLTPANLLTRHETWINKRDLVADFDRIPTAIPNDQLREQISNYFRSLLPKKPSQREENEAVQKTLRQFPSLIDYYIRYKEEHGDQATGRSERNVELSRQLYVQQFTKLPELLASQTAFYEIEETLNAARERAHFLKDVIENKGGHRIFYLKGQPIEREEDLQVLYRLTWFATSLDVGREVNDGRGPADFKISRGSSDKSLVEMKLASNSRLRRNLEQQTKIYEKASDAPVTVKVILCFDENDMSKVNRVLTELKMIGDPNVVVIDARSDNKPSGSKA